MATRSIIAFENPDTGKIQSVYCHWDGYISNNGVLLQEHFNCPDKVKELFSHGDISSLGDSIDSCVFYHRDRNEKLNLRKELTMEEFVSEIGEYDYAYLMSNHGGKFNWFVMDHNGDGELLSDAIETAKTKDSM